MAGKNAAFCTSSGPLFPYNVYFNKSEFFKLQKQIIWMQIDIDEVPSMAETKEPTTKTLIFNVLNYRNELSS